MNFAQFPISLPLSSLINRPPGSYSPLQTLYHENGNSTSSDDSCHDGDPASPTPSGSQRSYDHGITGQKVIEEIGLTDRDLIKIKTKDLNNLLKGVPKNRQKEIKSERRTYKNRIYADNCRKKRLLEKEQLEIYLKDMSTEMERMQQEIQDNRFKVMGYINSCDTLLRSLDKYEDGPELKKKIKDDIWNKSESEQRPSKEIFDKLGESDLEKT